MTRAGTAYGGSVYHAVTELWAHGDGSPRAACSFRTLLVETGDARLIPEHHRCRRQGCIQLFEKADQEGSR